MASDARIRITEAIYGELSSKERCITVTDVLNNWLTYYDGLYLRLPPETKNTLPDPAKGRKKQFKITYVINGVERTNLYGEYEEVEIIAEREPSVEPSVALALPLVLKGNEALVNELITRHAPEVRLHREEQYYPCSIEWYLRLCELCYDGKQVIDNDPRVVPTLQTFEQILHTTTIAGVKHTAEEPNSDFYVTPTKDNKAVAYAGVRELDSVPIYTHVIQYDDTKEIDIQYYFFYAYNGPIVALLQKAGTHEGDWEHVTMRLAPDGSLRAVFMDTYPKEHKWYMQEASSPRAHDGFVLNKEGHPIVWAAKHSHTSYAWAGLQRRTVGLGIVDEVTDDFGMHWQTWRRVINIGNSDKPLNGQLWVRFAGSWGTPARNKLDYGGKRTPSMLHAYRFGDPPPDRTSMLPNDGASHRHCGIPQTTVSRMLVRDAERAVTWSHWRRVEELPPVRVLGCGPVAATADGAVWARTDADQWQALGTAPPRLRSLCLQGGTLWAAGLDGSVASRPAAAAASAAAAWTPHPVQLSWITCGGSRVYGVSLAGTDVLVRTERQWEPLLPPPPHPLSTLSASADGALFATTSDGRAFFRLSGAAAPWLPASADARFASAAIATDVDGLAVSLGTRKLLRWNGVVFAPTEELFSTVTTGADGTFYALDEDGAVAKLCRRSLRLCPVRSFTKICDDRGIDSAPQPITFFRPVPLHGFAVLGDFVEQTQMTQPHWTAAALSVAEDTNDASGAPLLADPVGFDCVWMAVGTRAKVPFSLWRPIAPECYAALGYVAVASADAAPRVQVKCVHHSLLAQGLWKPQGAERYLWSDKRLGTKLAPVSLWASEAHGADMVVGTFGTSPTYEEPGDPPLCIRGTL